MLTVEGKDVEDTKMGEDAINHVVADDSMPLNWRFMQLIAPVVSRL